jgi:acyl-CoA dehydrogenase
MSRYFFETDEHATLRRQIRRFASTEICPHAHAWDEAGMFPRELFTKAAEAGFLGIGFPEELGGLGGDITHVIVAADEIICSGHQAGVAAGLGSLAIGLPPIMKLGNEEQKRRFVPPVLSGEKISALAITEPGAGSDVAGIKTRAVRDGDFYVVNGSKTFITSGSRADYITTAVRTGGPGAAGISMLVVERGTEGFSSGKPMKKMGWCASDTAELFFDDMRVPVANLVGAENGGFMGIMANFVGERLFLACQCVAIAELAMRESVAYVREREAFGRPIVSFQVTRHKLAEMSTRLAAARAITGELTMRTERGENDAVLAAKAKNVATDAASFVVDQAVQLHGGSGYIREVTVERLYRDVRLYAIGGGTREIMNEIISKAEGY